MRPGQYAREGLMEYKTNAARAGGGRLRWYTVGSERIETDETARVLPLWEARAFCAMRPGQYASGSLMEYKTKAARAGGGRLRWYTVGSERIETDETARAVPWWEARAFCVMRRAIRGGMRPRQFAREGLME